MRFIFFLAGLLLTSPARSAAPPYDPSPYTATGVITGATLNNASDVLSGGTLTLNGFTVTIPRNLLVNTPSITAIAWSELFKPDRTINLPLWPQVSWEASIFANFIGGKYVAGLVYIFQELGNINQGFISHIDYDKGEIRVGGDSANPSTVGRYGKVHGDWPIWTADTDNPSIVASTGFPVCVPRVDPAVADDPLCPKKNRPVDGAGKALSAFTFDAPPVAAGRPDPNFFAPLVVGDFITYSGTVVSDGLIAVYTLEANLGIYTAPGTSPAYIRIADLQAGVNGSEQYFQFSTDPLAHYTKILPVK
ncbi:hypothetical protein C8J56DRAFT_791150 [Mycena floridula]|nr:hypothetical protein C8J56DRAFT_791150 [Mycena floridula]